MRIMPYRRPQVAGVTTPYWMATPTPLMVMSDCVRFIVTATATFCSRTADVGSPPACVRHLRQGAASHRAIESLAGTRPTRIIQLRENRTAASSGKARLICAQRIVAAGPAVRNQPADRCMNCGDYSVWLRRRLDLRC
jgi:hypothetical protein